MSGADFDNPYLSVVIPAYNEEDRLGTTIAAVRSYARTKSFATEVIVVDDGSRDKTAERAADALRGFAGGRLIRLPRNLGKGAAVKAGVLAARGDLILFSDADLSTPIEELDRFLPWIEQGFDVVIGSRALPGADIRARQSRFRELMGKTFNRILRRAFLEDIPDTQCGFKLFSEKAAKAVFPLVETRGFSFDVEALLLCRRFGFRIRQVPVVWCNSPQSKVRIVGSSLAMLVELWKLKRRHRNPSDWRE
jgi:dolichyl-phosphate beta-glucosyltransferase